MYVDKYDFFVLFFEYLLLKLGGLIETAVGIHYCFENVIRKPLDKTRVIKNIYIDYVFKMFPKTKNSFTQKQLLYNGNLLPRVYIKVLFKSIICWHIV